MEAVTMAISAMKGRVSRVASELEKLNNGLNEAELIDSAFVFTVCQLETLRGRVRAANAVHIMCTINFMHKKGATKVRNPLL